MRRILWAIFLFLVVFWSGVFVAKHYFRATDDVIEDSQIIVQQIEKVCKLVTVEGHFIEYYDYGDPPKGPLFVGPFINFEALLPRKSAQMRVRATVSVGYDLTNLQVDAFPEERVIRLSRIPEPAVMSVDHEVDYFDDQSSIFRPLSDEDIVEMGRGAEAKIRDAAEAGSLLEAAREQGNEVFDLIEFIVTTSGWTLEMHSDSLPGNPEISLPQPLPDSISPGQGRWDYLDDDQ